MAAIGNEMAKELNGSFCFLSNYLYGSCLALCDKGVPTKEIEKNYQEILMRLCKRYRPAPKIEGENDVLDFHQSFKRSDLIPKLEIDLQGKKTRKKS